VDVSVSLPDSLRTRGALTAWHGNSKRCDAGRGGTPGTGLLRRWAWDAPKSEARRVGREATTQSPAKARARLAPSGGRGEQKFAS